MEKEYLQDKPSMNIDIIDIEVPCGINCLEKSKYKDLLRNENFKAQLEVVDSLTDLINVNVNTLKRELESIFSDFNVNIDNLLYTIFRLIEYGGDVIIGNGIKYNDRIIAEGNFETLMRIYRKMEDIRKDSNIISICDEIRYLEEALWEHFNKNLRRSLYES
jgi:predicted transcriptional regulator